MSNTSSAEYERQYLEEVIGYIDERTDELESKAADAEELIVEQNRRIRDDNPYAGVYAESEMLGETGISYSEEIYEQEKLRAEAEKAMMECKMLRKVRSNPYFVRIDFRESGYDDDEPIYIGLKGIFNPDSMSMYVCDWRAPIATLFYESFTDGNACYEGPEPEKKKIYGKISLIRQFKIENGEIKLFSDNDIAVNDDMLMEALSEGVKDKLKVIISTIQRDQNKAIRFSDKSNLLVVGPAGSGKTSVGFHRIAYLLYKNRNVLKSDRIALFSNSNIFSSYVADIIPELGEARIGNISFYDLFERNIGKYSVNDCFALSDAIINGDSLQAEAAELKYSTDFISYTEGQIKNYSFNFSDVMLYGDVVIKKEEFQANDARYKDTSMSWRREKACDLVEYNIERYYLDNEEKLSEIIDRTEQENTSMVNLLVQWKKRDISAATSEVSGKMFIDAVMLYRSFLMKYIRENGLNKEIFTDMDSKLKNNQLDFVDAVLIIYIQLLIGRIEPNNKIDHVLIDEAQDFSRLQHIIIRRLFPKAVYTVLADGNQAIVPSLNTPSTEEIASLYKAETQVLDRSYRSTEQINRLALRYIDNKYFVFSRNGQEPQFKDTDDIVGAINEYLNTDGNDTVCIITKSIAQAREIYTQMGSPKDVLLCDDKEGVASGKKIIMPLVYTKGLEFDNVVVVDRLTDDFDVPQNRRLFYMAVTRALHRLTILKEIRKK